MPNFSMSAAAYGAVRPNSTRLTETAAEIVAIDQPNSSWSGCIRTPGVARKPAAPTSATNATTATDQAGCTRFTRQLKRKVYRRTSGREVNMRKNRAMERSHRVVVLALDGVVSFDLGTPPQLFGAARDAAGKRKYEVITATPGGKPVRASGGFSVLPDHGLEVTEEADTVIVAGIHEGPTLWEGHPVPDVSAALIAAHRRGARVMSICTGAFVLAAAGLLDGRPATTHWWHAERFQRLFPAVHLDPDVLFIDDGDMLTSAGVGAGIDLCLHVIRRDHGSEIANRAARRS